MSKPTKAIAQSFFDQLSEIRIAPGDVTSVSPLTILVNGVSILAVPQNGITYNTTMPVIAIFPKRGGQPFVYQIGP
jgi:hypothetical protein